MAAFIDCPVTELTAHWPKDTVATVLAGESVPRSALASTVGVLTARPVPRGDVRLLGPYDPYLQLKDRDSLVPDGARRKALWPVLGRPGAIARDGELLGSWRPRSHGRALTLKVDLWDPPTGQSGLWPALEEQARDLADFRGQEFAGWANQ